MDSTGPLMIEIDGVNKHFGDHHVLKDVSLAVPAGQVVVVLGPSGSGKSTLCRTINRLEPVDSGSIAIDGARCRGRAKRSPSCGRRSVWSSSRSTSSRI